MYGNRVSCNLEDLEKCGSYIGALCWKINISVTVRHVYIPSNKLKRSFHDTTMAKYANIHPTFVRIDLKTQISACFSLINSITLSQGNTWKFKITL